MLGEVVVVLTGLDVDMVLWEAVRASHCFGAAQRLLFLLSGGRAGFLWRQVMVGCVMAGDGWTDSDVFVYGRVKFRLVDESQIGRSWMKCEELDLGWPK